MSYYFPTPNATGFPGMFTYANIITDNLFGISILAIIFVVAFTLGSKENTGHAYASASFITMLFSFFFGVLNLIPGEVILIFIVMTALAAFVLKRGT